MRNRPCTLDSCSTRANRRAAFTLIEILLALSLFMVLLAVIFVPLNNAFQIFNSGRTSIALQGAADSTVQTIAAELKGAIAVYPNDNMPGITDRSPYSTSGVSVPPYYEGAACSATRVSNISRIDFILPRRSSGTVDNPVKAERYLVTYYARRFNAYSSSTDPFDRFSNPIGLFRAQTPYVNNSDNSAITSDDLLYTDDTRYGGCSATKSKWLAQSTYGANDHPAEPVVGSLAADSADGVPGSDTLVSPRDMSLSIIDTNTMQPDLNFTCEDTDGNGVIDRVTISLTLIQYEEGNSGRNGQPSGQRVSASQVVNLPNTRLGV